MPATSTIATFGDQLQSTGFDYLFWILQYIFPVLITIAVIGIIWGVVMGIVHMHARKRR